MLALIIILVIVVLVGLYAVFSYNGLVSLRNRIENAWAQIDVQLKRRYDLIPNLVETVKGYASHERGDARRGHPGPQCRHERQRAPDQAEAENQITGALKSLFALSEAYPDLKANQNFAQPQEELTGTEGRIAYARQFYNDTVYRYNTKIQSFLQRARQRLPLLRARVLPRPTTSRAARPRCSSERHRSPSVLRVRPGSVQQRAVAGCSSPGS